MGRYLLRRIALSFVVLAGVTLVAFMVTRLIGDPARLMLPLEATPDQYLALRQQLGLDDPLAVQLLRFLVALAHGDTGISTWQGVPAVELVLGRIPATLYLAALAIAVSFIGAVLLGTAAAMRPGGPIDRAATLFSTLGFSVPPFWAALMLILVFAVELHWFKTSGIGGPEYATLPLVALAAPTAARLTQLVRSSMMDELVAPYVTTARAKGLAQRTVILRHALRNAAIPIITLTGDEATRLVSGAIVVETIFGWPGVGQLTLTAIEQRDFPVVQAIVIVVASLVVLLNLVVDLAYAVVDPRIRYS